MNHSTNSAFVIVQPQPIHGRVLIGGIPPNPFSQLTDEKFNIMRQQNITLRETVRVARKDAITMTENYNTLKQMYLNLLKNQTVLIQQVEQLKRKVRDDDDIDEASPKRVA